MKYPLEISLKCVHILEQNYHINELWHRKEFKDFVDEVIEQTKDFPKRSKLYSRIMAIANNISCECKVCKKNHGKYNKDFCSGRCKKIYNQNNSLQKKLDLIYLKGETKFKDVNPSEYIVCQICNAKMVELGRHLKIHNITGDEYKIKYNNQKLTCERKCDSLKGENNPSYNHQGKYSKWSKNFIHGYDEELHRLNNERQTIRMQTEEGRKHSVFCKEHYETEDDYLNFQRKDLNFFVSKYGEEEGLLRYQSKTDTWIKSFNKLNYSKVSQDLFNSILEYYSSDDIYFATYKRKGNSESYNKEYKLKFSNGHCIFPDFIDTNTKKIIEFDGTYWHSDKNPKKYKFSEDRDIWIKEHGFEVLHIAEEDYRKNPKNVLVKCLFYLYG